MKQRSSLTSFSQIFQMGTTLWRLFPKFFKRGPLVDDVFFPDFSNGGPSLTSFPQIFQSNFKAIYRDQTKWKILHLELCVFFEVKNLTFHHFSKIWKFNNTWESIKSKLAQKGAKFVLYVWTVLKRPNSITIFFKVVIHVWDQFCKDIMAHS